MFLKHFETNRYSIEFLLDNSSELVSFDKCFELNMPEVLPKSFKVRDGRVFCKTKLTKPENTVTRITCKGKVTFSDLKALLSTVFDLKKIRRLNEMTFITVHKEQILEMGQEIIGKDQVESIINKRL